MNSLFFKIFLWFWLSIVVVTATLVTSAALIRSRSAEDERWRQRYGLTLELRSHHEAELVDQQGADAAAKYIEALEQRDPMLDYMFDESGREVLGRAVPSEVVRMLSSLSDAPPAKPYFFNHERVMAERVVGPGGRPYLFILTFPPRPLVPHSMIDFLFQDLTQSILRLIAVLVTAAIFCLWLARHFTKPISKLRLAAREIAGGHLEARVDPSVVTRRDELAELGRDFDRMAERLNALVSAHRQLLADVSHELRSPLTRLNLALGLARQRTSPEALEHLNRIELETDRLNKLIGQLLNLARIESGVDLQGKKAFDLGVLVQEVASDGDYEARNRNCSVKFEQGFPCIIEGAPEILRGAIENVVRNAVRHTNDGTSVDISLDCETERGFPFANIRVRDHGTGIADEDLVHLFTPFHRVAEGVRRDPAGAGLGLAIAERAFRLHGGNVTAANAPDGGLVVTLELPVLTRNGSSE